MMKKNNNIQNTHGITPICTDAIGTDAIGRDAIGTDAIGRDAINRVSTTENAVPELRFHEFSDDWQVKTLGAVADRITRKNTENNQNVLTISAQYGLISQYDFFNKNVASNNVTNYYLIYKGEFAYNKSRSGGYTFGAIKPLKKYEKGVVSTLYICFGIKENYDKDFFEHYFETTFFNNKIGKIAQEGARNHGLLNISADDFFNLQIVIPTLPEQRKIAACLSSLDELIKSVRTKIDLLKKHKKGLMQKMFPSGDGMANGTDNGATNGADNGTTNGASNDTPNGRDAINRVSTTATTTANAVPELRFPEFSGDWQMKTLGEIAEMFSGGTPSVGKSEYYNGQIPFIRSGEINKNKTDLFISEMGLEKSSAKIVKKGTLLYALYGATSGETALSQIDGAINQAVLAIIPQPNYLPYYICQFLKFKKDYITSNFLQGGQGNLSSKIVAGIKIPFPTLAEQRKIAACLSSLDAEIQKYEQKLQMLEQHKKGLMQKMFVKM